MFPAVVGGWLRDTQPFLQAKTQISTVAIPAHALNSARPRETPLTRVRRFLLRLEQMLGMQWWNRHLGQLSPNSALKLGQLSLPKCSGKPSRRTDFLYS